VIDEAWMTTEEDYWKLFGGIAGVGIGASPESWAKLMTKRLASGGWSSPGLWAPGRPVAVKGFWCRVNAELIIHGATEPKAAVTIQGQPVAVRKDGTFSVRLAMPDGSQQLAIEVMSADGRHTKQLVPVISLAWSGELAPSPPTKPGSPGRTAGFGEGVRRQPRAGARGERPSEDA
jgi:hypothetical protein